MPFPNVPIPNPGDVISSAWGKAVADAINAIALAWDTLETQRLTCTTSLVLGTSLTDLVGATYTATPNVPENWLLTAIFDFETNTVGAGLLTGAIVLDGVTVATGYGDGAALGRRTVAVAVTQFPASGAAHTVKLAASKSLAGGAASAYQTGSRLLVQRVAREIYP